MSSEKICPACEAKFSSDQAVCSEDGTLLIWHKRFLPEIYEVIKIVDSDQKATIYEARHRILQKPVCIKMLQHHLMADKKAWTEMQDEAKNASVSGDVRIYDFGVSNSGVPYFVFDPADLAKVWTASKT